MNIKILFVDMFEMCNPYLNHPLMIFLDLHLWKWMGIETEGDALGFVISTPSVAGSTGIMIRKGKMTLFALW